MKKCRLQQIICICLFGWASLLAASMPPKAESSFEEKKATPPLGSWQLHLTSRAGAFYLNVQCSVAENCYLYRESTFVTVHLADNTQVRLPPLSADDKSEPYLKSGNHFWQGHFPDLPLKITVNFQGCTTGGDEGEMCLMPDSFSWDCTTIKRTPAVAADTEKTAVLPADLQQALARFPHQRAVSGLLNAQELIGFIENSAAAPDETSAGNSGQRGLWAILLLVVLGGLGLNLTPCVLPMIPINLAIIGASGSNISRWQGFRRGGAYAVGITLTYGILGVLAAVTGSRFGALNSSSIFNWVIALIFLLLALGMLGVYEIDFSRLGNLFRRNGGKKRQLPPALSAFLLGIMAALLAGACVAPVVISVILLAGKFYSEGSSWGLLLPFALGFSMALPWPLLGAGLSFLPKPGAWMVRVKHLFGVIILLMAVYYAYLGVNLYRHAADQQRKLDTLAGELDHAAASGQTVLIDCWATWCKNCAAQEKVFQAPEVKKILQKHNIRIIRFQAENLNDPAVKAFMEKYDLPGLPSLVLLKK